MIDLQAWQASRALALPDTAADLRRSVRAQLLKASDDRKINTAPHQIHKHVQLFDGVENGTFCITGGDKNQERSKGLAHFERNDGAWFDFAITVRERSRSLELLAYDFEIRFGFGAGVPFLRFDLNPPGHANEAKELRSHLHPGSDDALVPAPLMTPAELLELMIDRIRPPDGRKSRALTEFERSWFQGAADRVKTE